MLACHLLNTLVKKVFTMYQWSKYIAPSTILLEMFFGTICCFLKVFFFELRTKRSFRFRSRSCLSFAIRPVASQNIGQHSCTICECLPCSSDRQMPSSFGEWWELDKGGLTHFLLRKFNVGNSKILWPRPMEFWKSWLNRLAKEKLPICHLESWLFESAHKSWFSQRRVQWKLKIATDFHHVCVHARNLIGACKCYVTTQNRRKQKETLFCFEYNSFKWICTSKQIV